MTTKYSKLLLYLSFSTFVLFNGCSTIKRDNHQIVLANQVTFQLQAVPESFLNIGELLLVDVISPNEKRRKLLVQLETSNHKMVMSGSTLDGVSLFLVEWQFEIREIRVETYVPISIDPLRVLAEYQLAKWPLSQAQKGLHSAHDLSDNGQVRELVSSGQTIYQVHYSENEAKIKNLLSGYTVTVKKIETWVIK